MEASARALMNSPPIQLCAQFSGSLARACVFPGDDVCNGTAIGIYTDEAMPEGVGCHSSDREGQRASSFQGFIDRRGNGCNEFIGVNRDLSIVREGKFIGFLGLYSRYRVSIGGEQQSAS